MKNEKTSKKVTKMDEYKETFPFHRDKDDFTQNFDIDPEYLDPQSPEYISYTFNTCLDELQNFLIFDNSNTIVDLNTDNVEELCELLSRLLLCFSNGRIIEESEVIAPTFYIPIRILLEKAEIIERPIIEHLLEIVHYIVVEYSNEMIYEFAQPLIHITLNSSGKLLQRGSIIIANIMAEINEKCTDQLNKLQCIINQQLSSFFLNIIKTNSDEIIMKNIFHYFANLLFQSWINNDLMNDLSEKLLHNLCDATMAFVSPAIEMKLMVSALNLIVEIARFDPQISHLLQLNIVDSVLNILSTQQEAQREATIKSENGIESSPDDPDFIDDEVISIFQKTTYNSFCIINIITNYELKNNKEISFFKDDRFESIMHESLLTDYTPTKQLAFKLLANTSGICCDFYHEKGIMTFLIEHYNSMNYSEKLFLLQAFVSFLFQLPKETAQEYISEDVISLIEELIDDSAVESTEALCEILYSLLDNRITELIQVSQIPQFLESFLLENEDECPHANLLLSALSE